jgi:hypothetical protein
MHKKTSPKHCQLSSKNGIHVETSKMQKHLDGMKMERWNHTQEEQGALGEHCDLIKLDI